MSHDPHCSRVGEGRKARRGFLKGNPFHSPRDLTSGISPPPATLPAEPDKLLYLRRICKSASVDLAREQLMKPSAQQQIRGFFFQREASCSALRSQLLGLSLHQPWVWRNTWTVESAIGFVTTAVLTVPGVAIYVDGSTTRRSLSVIGLLHV